MRHTLHSCKLTSGWQNWAELREEVHKLVLLDNPVCVNSKTGFGVLNDFALKFYLWHFSILNFLLFISQFWLFLRILRNILKKGEFREKHTLEINYSVVRKKKITTELQYVKSEFRENVRIEIYKLWIARENSY